MQSTVNATPAGQDLSSSEGYRVLRFWNNEVLGNIDGVLEMIQSACLATPTPTPPHKGEGKERAP